MYLNEKLKSLWHGADYNPDQWLSHPEVFEKDIEYMKKAGCNVMSVGIFAWAKLEPEEGVFDFTWLDETIDRLYQNGIYTILATPTGAMPAWMAEQYPEVRRMAEDGVRYRYGNRHNHCYSSPVYREKTRIINTKLAERYARHPGVLMWHVSNEYNVGDCHCPLCVENFRNWLREKYGTIENLNEKWWSGFWSHIYQDFSQIEPPGEHGEYSSNPLKLDWQRFKNHLLREYAACEVDALKAVDPSIPTTTNFMGFFEVDYARLAEQFDVVSWDNYPAWHKSEDEFHTARWAAFFHSLFNSMKEDRPFMLMESSPSATNWQPVSKLRAPGMHRLASLQAVAHGSDTVQYFQWRKSRGQSEQFHGAVVGHDNTDDTRVFRDVASVGALLGDIREIAGSKTNNKVAILMDYENIWSLRNAQALRNEDADKGYEDVLFKHYGALWRSNIGCDIIFDNADFSKYQVIIAPMLFMLKHGLKEKLEAFVARGGQFVTTFATAQIDEFGLCYFDDECYPLRKLLGVKPEECDSLYHGQTNSAKLFGKEYQSGRYCELAYPEGAEVLAVYESDFYQGMPAVTVNHFGAGKAYYIATDFDDDGYRDLFRAWFSDLALETPENVSVTTRVKDGETYVFVMNFNNETKAVKLPFAYECIGGAFEHETLQPFGVAVLKKR